MKRVLSFVALLAFTSSGFSSRAAEATDAVVRVESALGWDAAKQSAHVTALARDGQSTIWAATESGMFRYRPALRRKSAGSTTRLGKA